jgi:hypothetical protein
MVKVMVRAPHDDGSREPSPEKVLRPLDAEIVAARQGHRTVCDQTAAARNSAVLRNIHLRRDVTGRRKP